MKRQKVYIYTRVSTAIQTEGYSLEAQRQKIIDYAKYRGFHICGEYQDAGFSGKNIAGRAKFQEMLDHIEAKKDDIQYVLVFKLSRFGRNAADVLSSLQFMQDYGVNLICVEDNIDSSADSGKLMISVMSAMAEIERENILVQTMAGRKQKASCGGWNGGFAPYGYELKDGQLTIVEDEAEVIRAVYNLYIGTNKGPTYIAKELNKMFVKKVKKQGETNRFTTHFVKRAIDNPVYCGRIAYGRTVNEKIEGKRNEYHRILQKDGSKIILSYGTHAPIVSEEMWELARKRREDNAYVPEKIEKEHYYILAGLLRCPYCGARMYGKRNGNAVRKDGTPYAPSYSYICRSHFAEAAEACPKPTSYSESVLLKIIKEIMISMVHDDGFQDLMDRSLQENYDADKINENIENAQKELRRLQRAQLQIENQLNAIDYDDDDALQVEESLNIRLHRVFADIRQIEGAIVSLREQVKNAETLAETQQGIYDFLKHFEEFYDLMEDIDRRDMFKSFISHIELYPKGREHKGQWVKSVHLKFPMSMKDGKMFRTVFLDGGSDFRTLTDNRGACDF